MGDCLLLGLTFDEVEDAAAEIVDYLALFLQFLAFDGGEALTLAAALGNNANFQLLRMKKLSLFRVEEQRGVQSIGLVVDVEEELENGLDL